MNDQPSINPDPNGTPTGAGGPRRRIRRPWRVAATVFACLIVASLVAIAFLLPLSSNAAREKLIEGLSSRLDAEVELAELQIAFFPSVTVEGKGLAIRHKGRSDVPPLIAIERFSAEGTITGLLRRHVARVTVGGLDIQIPPKEVRRESSIRVTDSASGDGSADGDSSDMAKSFVIDELVSENGRLVIIPGEADKPSKIWNIHTLRMTGLAAGRAMPFEATLRNAVPPGDIDVEGSFGPWGVEEPGTTPLDGEFVFARADLGVFKGISGILSAKGSFEGSLERIEVRGRTETPDFTVEAGGHPIPLHADYHAIVDGTNGNTLLERIDATFLDTALTAIGGVVKHPGDEGRTVSLDVTMDRARLEDVLKMAVKTPKPPMTGGLKLTTRLVIPPGDRDVVQKLQLDGAFTIADTRFTDAGVQTKINGLSQRSRGDHSEKTPRVASQFAGRFKLRDGQLAIPHVTFDVPGAAVRLAGSYGLRSEQIDFEGMAFTDARISQMTTGFKSLLLKPVDLLFRRKGGGAAIPIKVAGTRNDPAFGLDKGRVFKR